MTAVEFNDAQHFGIFTTSASLTSQTGKMVRQSELVLAALRAQGVFDNLVDDTTAPAHDKLWLDKNSDPAVLKEWDSIGSAWVAMTFDRLFGRAIVTELTNVGGTANAVTVDKPTNFIDNRLYSLTPTANNTGATTIQVAGVGAYDAKYHDGSDLNENEFVGGQNTVLLFTNGRFEVLYPFAGVSAERVAAETAKTAAETAQAAAEAAAASLNLPTIETAKFLVGNASADGYDKKVLGAAGAEMAAAATRRAAMDLIVGPAHYNFLNSGGSNDFTGDMGAVLNGLLGESGPSVLPVGAELHIPAGTYKITTPIVQRRFVNIRCEGDVNLQGVFASADPVWKISIAAGLAGYSDAPRNMYFGGGGRIVNFAGGTEAMLVTQDAGDLALFRLLIQHIRLSGFDPNDGTLANAGLRLAGYVAGVSNGPTFCTVRDCTLVGGAWLDKVADGNIVEECMMLGSNARGARLDIVSGAAKTTVRNNCITTGQGALEIIDGSQIDFLDNQCEQGNGAINTLNKLAGDVTCMVLVRGATRRVQSARITGNNFGCGIGLVDMAYVIDNAEDVWLGDNAHFPGTLYIDGKLTANSRYNHLGAPRQLRGNRSSANGYDSRTDRRYRVQDLGEGNSGMWRSLPVVAALQNGFTNSGAYLRRDRPGVVTFEGSIVFGSSISEGLLIATLPAGLRPAQLARLNVPVYDTSAAVEGRGQLSINTSGELRLVDYPAGTETADVINLDGISYVAQRAVYDGSD